MTSTGRTHAAAGEELQLVDALTIVDAFAEAVQLHDVEGDAVERKGNAGEHGEGLTPAARGMMPARIVSHGERPRGKVGRSSG